MIKLMEDGHMLLVGGKKPKIHLNVKGKKFNTQAIIGNLRKLKSLWASIQNAGGVSL